MPNATSNTPSAALRKTVRQVGIRQRSLRRCRLGRATELVFILATGITLTLSDGVQAQTWDGGAGNVNWDDPDNWDNDAVPGIGDTVTIDDDGVVDQPTANSDQTVAQTNVSAGTLTVDAVLTSPVTVSDTGVLQINATSEVIGDVETGGTSAQNDGTITGNLTVSGGVTTNAGEVSGTTTVTGGTLTLETGSDLAGGEILLVSGGTVNVNADDTVGSVEQTAGTIGGTETLTADDFDQTGGATGDTVTIVADTFSQSDGAVIGSGTTVTVATSSTLTGGTIAGLLDGTGTVTVSTGTTSVTGSIDGDVTVASGTLSLGSNTAVTGTITTTGSVIDIVGGVTSSALIDLDSNTTQLQVTAGTGTQAGVISETTGPHGFEKIGAGTLALTATNTYTGTTIISAGVLQVGAGGTTGTLGSGGVTNNAGLTFNRSDAITVGNAISGTGTLTQAGAGTTTLTGANSYGGTTTISAGVLQIGNGGTTGTLGSGGVTNNAGLTFNRSDAITVGNTISGTGTLTKAGAGNTTLTGPNSYSGLTTVSTGTLTASNATALGTTAAGTTVTSGAALALTGGITTAEDITINGTGVSAGGALRSVSGDNAVTGSITLGSAARINADAGTLTVGGGITGAGQNLTLGGAGNIDVTSAITTGSGTLTKDGAGTVELSGGNTFTGVTTVSAGTLNVSGGGALSDTARTNVATGATLGVLANETVGSLAGAGNVVLTGTLSTGGDNSGSTYSGVASGGGGLVKTGTGTMILSGANSYTGATDVTGGILEITGSLASTDLETTAGATLRTAGNALADTAAVTNAGTLGVQGTDLIGSVNGAGAVAIAAGQTLQLGTGVSLISGIVSGGTGGLTVQGTSDTTLSGANTYGGTTTIAGGTLRLSGGSAISNSGVVTMSAGALDVNTDETIGSLATTAGTVNLDATLTTGGNNGTTSIASVIDGTGGLTKAGTGTLTLTAVNTYSGDTTINGGTLSLSTGSVFGDVILNSGTLSIGNSLAVGGTITTNGSVIDYVDGVNEDSAIIVNSNTTQLQVLTGSAEQSGIISQNGGARPIEKIGAGTLTLSADNSYTGATTVTGGTLIVTGNIDSTVITVQTGASLSADGAALADLAAVTLNGTGNLTLTGPETIGSLASASGTSTVTLGSNTLTTGGNDGTTGFAGNISGTGGLTKAGIGTMTLSGTNGYTGETTVNAGILVVTGTVGSTDATVNSGGTLRVDGAALDDTIAVLLNGTGILELTGSETIGSLASASTTSSVVLGANTLTLGDTSNNDILSAISGTGGLTVQGTGEVALGGTNTYTGETLVTSGTLALFNGAALADTAALVVEAPGTVEILNSETIGSLEGEAGSVVDLNTTVGNVTLTVGDTNTTTFAGNITDTSDLNASNLVKTGTGTLTLSGTNDYNGFTDVMAGELEVTGTITSLDIETAIGATLRTDGGALDEDAAVTNAGVVVFEGAESIASLNGAGTVALDNAAILTLNSGASAISGIISGDGGLTVTGTSDTTLTAANTYTGDTDVAGTGQLSVTGAGTLASLDIETAGTGTFDTDGNALLIGTQITNGSTALAALTFTGPESIASLNGAGTVFLNGVGATLQLNTGASAISGVISGSGGLIVTGTSETTLTAANSYTGTTVVSGGILNVTGGTIAGPVESSLGTVNLSAGGALSGGLTNTGATFNVLTGSSGSTGALTNTSGTMNVESGATLAATSVDVNGGSFNLNAGAVTGATFDNAAALNVSGSSSIANAFANTGTIDLTGTAGTADSLALSTLSSGALGAIAANLDFDAGLSDQISSAGGGITQADLTFTNTGNGVTGPITVLTGLNGGAALTSNLPLGGSIVRVLTQNGNLAQVVSLVNPSISGIASAASVTQSLIASIVNRPTSPFVSGLAAEETCSSGGYARLTGGIATVTGTSISNGQPVSNDVDSRYWGLQGGYDFGCFDGRYANGWDGAIGIMGGVNYGSTEQNVYQDPLDNTSAVTGTSGSDFDQSYLGIYAAASRDKISGDLQLRFDNTRFTLSESEIIANTAAGFDGAEFSTTTSTVGMRFNYRQTLNEEKGISVVPTIGFNYSRTSGDTVTFNGDGLGPDESLTLDPFNSFVGFFGATIAQTKVSEAGDSASTLFASGNYYNDFSDERTATFTDEFGGVNNIVLDGIGGFAEASVGLNYVKVLDGGSAGAKQLNANIRADARFGDNVKDAYSLTAQVRLSF